jgi:hypothetical protein
MELDHMENTKTYSLYVARGLLLLGLGVMSLPQVFAQTAVNPCPFASEYVSKELGKNFAAGVPEPGLIGKACVYKDKAAGVQFLIDAGKNQAPSADMWRKMSNPPGTKWAVVANDPDKAVLIELDANNKYPTLSYERKGILVTTRIIGADTESKAGFDAWSNKLVKMKRVPE